MTIQTKFNIGDQIYFLHEGKIWMRPIHSINADYYIPDKKFEIKYFVNVGTDSAFKSEIIYEDKAFETREKLIESL